MRDPSSRRRGSPPAPPPPRRAVARRRGQEGLVGDTRGSALLEYIVLVGVVALLGIAAFTGYGTDVSSAVHREGVDVSQLGF